ncbi:MAG TPA: hypothetical protein VK129_04245, partial [Terriglobales bacterium]|nr:hypothetical protein [Terriglobales bacterium]
APERLPVLFLPAVSLQPLAAAEKIQAAFVSLKRRSCRKQLVYQTRMRPVTASAFCFQGPPASALMPACRRHLRSEDEIRKTENTMADFAPFAPESPIAAKETQEA